MAAPMKITKHFQFVQRVINGAYLSQHSNQKAKNETLKTPVPEHTCIDNDWVGPPDKISNIRPMKFHVPEDESDLERQYREQRQALLDWHHLFWTEHNKSFFIKKEEFVQKKLAEKQAECKSETSQSVTPEELSVFYKKFLDENYKTHIQYNKEWYKKNIKLLWPALKVNIYRLLNKRTGKSKR